jgi:hypothetical protein
MKAAFFAALTLALLGESLASPLRYDKNDTHLFRRGNTNKTMKYSRPGQEHLSSISTTGSGGHESTSSSRDNSQTNLIPKDRKVYTSRGKQKQVNKSAQGFSGEATTKPNKESGPSYVTGFDLDRVQTLQQASHRPSPVQDKQIYVQDTSDYTQIIGTPRLGSRKGKQVIDTSKQEKLGDNKEKWHIAPSQESASIAVGKHVPSKQKQKKKVTFRNDLNRIIEGEAVKDAGKERNYLVHDGDIPEPNAPAFWGSNYEEVLGHRFKLPLEHAQYIGAPTHGRKSRKETSKKKDVKVSSKSGLSSFQKDPRRHDRDLIDETVFDLSPTGSPRRKSDNEASSGVMSKRVGSRHVSNGKMKETIVVNWS